MEKNILNVGIMTLILGSVLILIGSTIPGALFLAVGALDLVAVIFWPKLFGTTSERAEYTLGNQVVDAGMIITGVALTAGTGKLVFMGATAGGIASLVVRYRSTP